MKKRGNTPEVENFHTREAVAVSLPAGRVSYARYLAEEGYGFEDLINICGISRRTAYWIVFGRPMK